MVRKLGTVMLLVSDIERSIAFYGDTLGLRVDRHGDTWAQADAGGIAIGLHATSEPVDAGSRGFALIFDVDDVEAALASLAERDVQAESGPKDEPYGTIATVRDPDGYAVQLLKPNY